MWEVGGASARGSAHVRKGLKNQDAILWSPATGASDTIIVAVSDGHGSQVHFLSDIGSRLAVEAAVATLGTFVERLKAAELSAITTASLDIPAQIHHAWRAKVDADLQASPLENAALAKGEDRFLPYGATLVAAAVAPRFLLLVQIGDGDLTVGFSNGRLTRPLPDDQGLVGEQTHSLCDPDAVRANRFRLQVLPVLDAGAGIDFLMLSTDGLSKSCPNDKAFMKLAADWRNTVRRDATDRVSESLASWLGKASERGSGDDITLGFAVRRTPASRATVPVDPTLPASLERRIRLATSLAYVSVAISLLSLLVVGRLWLAAPQATAMPPHEPPRTTFHRTRIEDTLPDSEPGAPRQQSPIESPEQAPAKPPN